MEIHFIETIKFMDFIKDLDLNNSLHRWLIFLKTDDKSLLEEVISMDKNIAEAEEKLDALNLSKDLKEAYDAREKELSDEITRMSGARDEGREEGRKEGRDGGKRELIEAMKRNGFTDEDIKRMVGVDPSKLN